MAEQNRVTRIPSIFDSEDDSDDEVQSPLAYKSATKPQDVAYVGEKEVLDNLSSNSEESGEPSLPLKLTGTVPETVTIDDKEPASDLQGVGSTSEDTNGTGTDLKEVDEEMVDESKKEDVADTKDDDNEKQNASDDEDSSASDDLGGSSSSFPAASENSMKDGDDKQSQLGNIEEPNKEFTEEAEETVTTDKDDKKDKSGSDLKLDSELPLDTGTCGSDTGEMDMGEKMDTETEEKDSKKQPIAASSESEFKETGVTEEIFEKVAEEKESENEDDIVELTTKSLNTEIAETIKGNVVKSSECKDPITSKESNNKDTSCSPANDKCTNITAVSQSKSPSIVEDEPMDVDETKCDVKTAPHELKIAIPKGNVGINSEKDSQTDTNQNTGNTSSGNNKPCSENATNDTNSSMTTQSESTLGGRMKVEDVYSDSEEESRGGASECTGSIKMDHFLVSETETTDLEDSSSHQGSSRSSSVEPGHSNLIINESGTLTPTKRKLTRKSRSVASSPVNLEDCMKPFQQGWKREIVLRAVYDTKKTRQADVYYYSPAGKKLRSKVQIQDYLTKHNITSLTPNNFTMLKDPLGVGEEYEIIRSATLKGERDSNKAMSPSSAHKKTLTFSPTTTKEKRAEFKKKRPFDDVEVIEEKPLVKQARTKSATEPTIHAKLSTTLPVTKLITTQSKVVPAQTKLKPILPKGRLPVQTQANQVVPVDNSKSGLSTADFICVSNTMRWVQPVSKPGPASKKQIVYTTKYANNVPHLSERILTPLLPKKSFGKNYHCTGYCPLGNGTVPCLQCVKCLCLFHPECTSTPTLAVNIIQNGSAKFLCPNCYRMNKENSTSNGWLPAKAYEPLAHDPTSDESGGEFDIPVEVVETDPMEHYTKVTLQPPDPPTPPTSPTSTSTSKSSRAKSASTTQNVAITHTIPSKEGTGSSNGNAGKGQVNAGNQLLQLQNPGGAQPRFVLFRGASGEMVSLPAGNQTKMQKVILPTNLVSNQMPLVIPTSTNQLIIPTSTQQIQTFALGQKNFVQNLCENYRILARIFKYLTVKDLLTASQVCLLWRDLAYSQTMWKTVRLKNVYIKDWRSFAGFLEKRDARSLDLQMIKNKIEISKTNMQDAHSVDMMDNIWKTAFPYLCEVKCLKRVVLPCCTIPVLQLLLQSCHQLTSVTVQDLNSTSGAKSFDPAHLLETPDLETLHISSDNGFSLSEFDFVRLLSLRKLTLRGVNGQWPNLSFELTTLHLKPVGSSPFLWANIGCMNNLVDLIVEDGGSVNDFALCEALGHLQSLQNLSLFNFTLGPRFGTTIKKLNKLRNLKILPVPVQEGDENVNEQTDNMVGTIHEALGLMKIREIVWGIRSKDLHMDRVFVSQKCFKANFTSVGGIESSSLGNGYWPLPFVEKMVKKLPSFRTRTKFTVVKVDDPSSWIKCSGK